MAAQDIAEILRDLSPQEQDSVRQFVQFLRQRRSPAPNPFLAAVDEFIEQHPELLQRLAQ